MTINFYINGESSMFHWVNATNIPRVGDYVKEDGKKYGDKLKVKEVVWINEDSIEVLTNRVY